MAESPNPSDTQSLGKAMAIMAWILVIVLLTLFFNQWFNIDNMASPPQILQKDGIKETVIRRNTHNQYLTQGTINGKEVSILLDTGSTDVVIPGNIAKELHLSQGIESLAGTAGGDVRVYQTVVTELIIGHLILRNIAATVNPSMKGNQILLGMSVLKKISFSQVGENMILSH